MQMTLIDLYYKKLIHLGIPQIDSSFAKKEEANVKCNFVSLQNCIFMLSLCWDCVNCVKNIKFFEMSKNIVYKRKKYAIIEYVGKNI